MLTLSERDEVLSRVEDLVVEVSREFSLERVEAAIGVRSVIAQEWFHNEREKTRAELGAGAAEGVRPHK